VNSERTAIICGLALLWSGGWALQSLEPPATTSAGDGAWCLVGAYRPLAADWFWLQADLAWEREDAEATRLLLGLALAADPRSSYFWLNSARMLAYDLPAWGAGHPDGSDGAWRAHRRKVGAAEALALLQQGLRWHPNSVIFHVEMGDLCLYALGDRARAAEYYRLAAAQPGAPAYAGRINRRLREPPR
jgi:tetratricopeptide (TPR) repeat protein